MTDSIPASRWRTEQSPAFFSPSNAVLWETSRQHHWQGTGSLSIKMFVSGQARYSVDGSPIVVDAAHYLILNQGQPYSVTIDAPTPVESFCVFFAPGFVEDVAHARSASTESSLDQRDPGDLPVLHFFERTYAHDQTLSPAVLDLRRRLALAPIEAGWLEERLHDLAGRLLHMHADICREVEALSAIRPATREEIYRRLHRARDYMVASFDQPLSLDDVSRVAALSPNHLLRTFRELFGQTPHQYLTELRIGRARWLLAHTDLPVTGVCQSVGFSSLGSFSWLFRRRTGLSPVAFRRQNG